MGGKGDNDGSEVEKNVDYDGPEDGEPPDILDVVERVDPVLASVVDGLDVQGREFRRRISIGGAIEGHLPDRWLAVRLNDYERPDTYDNIL